LELESRISQVSVLSWRASVISNDACRAKNQKKIYHTVTIVEGEEAKEFDYHGDDLTVPKIVSHLSFSENLSSTITT